jgi:excisionase family DNA binding protein
MDEKREFLKVPEVAEVLRIARSRAYELVAEGEIPSIRIGRSVRVSRSELERWLQEQRQPGTRWRSPPIEAFDATGSRRLIRYIRRSMIAAWCWARPERGKGASVDGQAR